VLEALLVVVRIRRVAGLRRLLQTKNSKATFFKTMLFCASCTE